VGRLQGKFVDREAEDAMNKFRDRLRITRRDAEHTIRKVVVIRSLSLNL
jgi:hypothetical protein